MEDNFNPDYTPIEMFTMGIFGGNYFKLVSILPEKFVLDLQRSKFKTQFKPDFKLNCYGIDCGTSLEWWQEKGLIHPDDPNGWVEWYIKYYHGRRHEDDARQIARFNAFKSRHGGMLKKFPDSLKTKQNLLQWGINYKLIK
jgi:hypothetical protein